MGKTIEQIWIRKTSSGLEPFSSLNRFGPDPLITISASGFQSAVFKGLTEDRTRSRPMAQKLLALRAATTEAPGFADAFFS